ncbi:MULTISPECIES: DUF805 domain-containing protein [Mesorhizobium]|uniref:DUF805 domain-containing protein n=1 Tax=Mesorhizobium denitrificans TaxID=2294114 RepID=A0A371XKM7_9HYPH|nr:MULTISPECIES: DUF805 domain-containing protein [Mesorhizobium]RFC69604.1 DUF805 domain-containing protein [Mesorhizobium denitrificans]
MKTRIDYIWLFLKPAGRLSRLPYFLATMLISVLASLLVYRHVLAYMPADAVDPWQTPPGLEQLITVLFIATLWPMIALTSKRLQDIGKPPIMSVAIALPVISVVAYIVLSLYPGTGGPNKYGSVRDMPPR